MRNGRTTRGNGHSPALNAQLRRLRIKVKIANRLAAKEIERNVRKFGIIANAAERDLSFRSELKRSWQDLRRVAQRQF
jgi:hypothetical protein